MKSPVNEPRFVVYIMYVFVSSSGGPVFTTLTTHDQKSRSRSLRTRLVTKITYI